MQIGELYADIKDKMTSAGIAEADMEARVILRELLSIDTAMLLGHPESEVGEPEYNQIQNIMNRRLMREPLQYILGRWNFMGLDFYVEPGILIPRPDTEVLVETTLEHLHDGMQILDLCTGTGCILISLLKYSNDCSGVGIDISPQAISLATRNAESILGNDSSVSIDLEPAYSFVRSNLYDELEPDSLYDIIVSNPPYIATSVIDTLEPEVKDHEPLLALDGGADGMDLVRRIINGASDHLVKGGFLALEIGYDQGEITCNLMRDAGFIEVQCIKDYAGLDRVVCGINPILR